MQGTDAQRYWQSAVRGLRRRVNFSAWLDRFGPLFFGAGIAAGFGAYALRRTQVESFDSWVGWGAGMGLSVLLAGVWAWWRERVRFFSETDARALLEHRMGLDSALSAAECGVAAWPAPRPVLTTLRWRAPGTLAWLLCAVAMAGAGATLPVLVPEAFAGRVADEQPPALAQAEEWLEKLVEQAVAETEDVEKLAKQARGLGERTPEERFSHSALEAADALRSQTAQAIRSLGSNLEDAAAALTPLERPAGSLSEEELGAVAARLGEALRGLQEGPLAARDELMEKLGASANAAGLRSLSPEQAAQLRQQLARAGRAATGVLGASGQGAAVAEADPDRLFTEGQCEAGGGGECFGLGGVGRGPGHAPLLFSDRASDAGDGRAETVSADDLSRAALGELLGMERGEHELDPKNAAGPSAGGSVAANAKGGEVVWVDRLTPKERSALKEFFK